MLVARTKPHRSMPLPRRVRSTGCGWNGASAPPSAKSELPSVTQSARRPPLVAKPEAATRPVAVPMAPPTTLARRCVMHI